MKIRYIVALFLLVNFVLAANVKVVESFNNSYKSKKIEKTRVKKKSIKYHKRKKRVTKQAKVVIIIDDITHSWQLAELQKLPFKVTPSIFPPNKMNMESNLLAKGLKHFMVHLPLESYSKQMNKMYKTLLASSSKKRIEQRVKEIRKLFPDARYINNHTGSKFTANYIASKRLYKSLMRHDFVFVDSRTSKNTEIPKIAKIFKKRYLKSDLFIDNKLSVVSIRKKITQGLNIAKKRGYIVMIGHPHPQTFKALRLSKRVLQKFKFLYIDELQ